jgi:hypothetical protein
MAEGLFQALPARNYYRELKINHSKIVSLPVNAEERHRRRVFPKQAVIGFYRADYRENECGGSQYYKHWYADT